MVDSKRRSDALADDGNITQALRPGFFPQAIGVCVDRFSTPWMVVGPQT